MAPSHSWTWLLLLALALLVSQARAQSGEGRALYLSSSNNFIIMFLSLIRLDDIIETLQGRMLVEKEGMKLR